MAVKIRKEANNRLANLFFVFTVSKKNERSSETKIAVHAIPFRKLSLSIYLLLYNKYTILVVQKESGKV